jgi:hypothetical protein
VLKHLMAAAVLVMAGGSTLAGEKDIAGRVERLGGSLHRTGLPGGRWETVIVLARTRAADADLAETRTA